MYGIWIDETENATKEGRLMPSKLPVALFWSIKLMFVYNYHTCTFFKTQIINQINYLHIFIWLSFCFTLHLCMHFLAQNTQNCVFSTIRKIDHKQ
jgi:hypothetical protein